MLGDRELLGLSVGDALGLIEEDGEPEGLLLGDIEEDADKDGEDDSDRDGEVDGDFDADKD